MEKMLDDNKKTNKLQKNVIEKKRWKNTGDKNETSKKIQNMQAACYRAKQVLIQYK